ncbi:MAG: UDP-N-acetylglucosamine 1-carboxyvinyltransferase [Aggregatilineales bacterium]
MRIRIEGRQPLRGTYRASGNSNAAVAAIAAALLSDAPVTLRNVPNTVSVGVMLEVAADLGTSVTPNEPCETVALHTPHLVARTVKREYSLALGGTLLFSAPILARRRQARLELDYAVSRIHPHLTALRDLGMDVHVSGTTVDIGAVTWRRREIVLTQMSVTATALVAMLAVALGEQTVIYNAASEPHIVDLLTLLGQFGAHIEGIGSNVVRIGGWGGAERAYPPAALTIAPDHIEVSSIAAIAALTGSRLSIEGARGRDLRLIAKVYERLGVHLELEEDAVHVPRHEHFMPSLREEDVDVSVESAPWYGFPSDLIAMATVLATQAHATTLIHEKLFPNRLLFVDKLNSMGAQIVLCDPHRAIVVGPTPLRADYLDNPDVRIGLALLGAALCAEGESVIDTAEAFERSFDHVLDKLVALGARIRRGE